MRLAILCTLLLTTSTATAQTPIPRVGDYCKQHSSDSGKEAIPREGKDCPGNWYKSGEYCVKHDS